MKLKSFLLLCVLLKTLLAPAQQPAFEYVDSSIMQEENADSSDDFIETDEADFTTDTVAHLYNMELSNDSVENWKSKKAYDPLQTVEQKLKAWKEAELKKTAPQQSGWLTGLVSVLNSGLLQLLLWVVAILFVGYIIRQLFLSKANFKWTNNTNKIKPGITEEKELGLHDFDALIRNAYKIEDYRIATRYLFLKVLQSLQTSGHITVAADKTNSQYLQELPEGLKKDFRGLVHFFEYTWYGINLPTQQTFDAKAGSFDAFLIRQRKEHNH